VLAVVVKDTPAAPSGARGGLPVVGGSG
jgi:hypothetical protein